MTHSLLGYQEYLPELVVAYLAKMGFCGSKRLGAPPVPRNMTDRAPQDPAVESDGRIGVQTVFEQPLDPTGTNGSA